MTIWRCGFLTTAAVLALSTVLSAQASVEVASNASASVSTNGHNLA